jgi:hypothetical protein
MKQIKVTEKNKKHFSAYQGTIGTPKIGDTLTVTGKDKPTKGLNIVTDWQPSDNSKRMLERENEPDADKYGWKFGAQVLRQTLAEKKQDFAFNRWNIKTENI